MNLFSIAEYSSALHHDEYGYHFVRLKKTHASVEIAEEYHSAAATTLKEFVEEHALWNTLAVLTPLETDTLSRVIDKNEIENDSPDELLHTYLPKGVDADSVSLQVSELNGGAKVLSFLHHNAELRIRQQASESVIIPHRIGGGLIEAGIALSSHLKNGFSGAVVVPYKSSTIILLYSDGRIVDTDSLRAGIDHLDENRQYYSNELSKVLVYYWETKLLRDPIREVAVVGNNVTITEFLREKGYTVIPTDSHITAQNLIAYSLAFNTLSHKHNTIDHTSTLIAERKQRIVLSLYTEWLLKRILPVAAVLLLLLFVSSKLLHMYTDKVEAGNVESSKLMEEYSAIEQDNLRIEHEMENAAALIQKGTSASELMQKISLALPSDVWLTSLRYNTAVEGPAMIEGVGRSNSAVERLFSKLEKSDYFSNVRLQFTQAVDKKQSANVRFGMEVTLP